MDRKDIIAMLNAKGITVNGDISYADLQAKLNEAIAGKDEKADPVVNSNEETPAWAADLLTKVNNLESKISVNTEQELTKARADVVALNKGYDKDMAADFSLATCNKILAANGHVSFNSSNQYRVDNSADDGIDSMVIPGSAQ